MGLAWIRGFFGKAAESRSKALLSMRRFLSRLILCLAFLCSVPSGALCGPEDSARLAVTAKIGSSMHIEWEKITEKDSRFHQLIAKTGGEDGNSGEFLRQLPFALVVKISTNDPNKVVKFHVEKPISRNREAIPSDRLFVSVDGSEKKSLEHDVTLRDRECDAEILERVLRFFLKSNLSIKSGEYSAKFSFIASDAL